MTIGWRWAAIVLAASVPVGGSQARPSEARGLHEALASLASEGAFSGAVVIRGPEGVRFARGYGLADPFTGVPFTPDTPVDSGSLAKPVTAAAVLLLRREGRIAFDTPVTRYLPEYPDPRTTVGHLLAHSAGLTVDESSEGLAGKDNAALLAEAGKRGALHAPGTAFSYCNACYSTLALLIERVSGVPYLEFVKQRAMLPAGVRLRPRRLADWKGRAIGYRIVDGEPERFDSWEGEAVYGSANLSVSAAELAQWGSEWWRPQLGAIRTLATTPAVIDGMRSGLSWGNWYCDPQRPRCHYLGHHEGLHHMLYWDAKRRISIAMVSNNTLPASFQQSLQRALVAFAENRPAAARREIRYRLPGGEPPVGAFKLCSGDELVVTRSDTGVSVERRGVRYPAYPTGSPVRYVPGLDGYLAGDRAGRVHWNTLYREIAPCRGG